MIRPTRRALLLVAEGCLVATTPAIFGAELWLLWVFFVGATALALGLDFVLAPRRREILSTLHSPEVLFVGATEPMRLAIHGPFRRACTVTAVVDVAGPLEPPPQVTLQCAPERATSAELPLRPGRRGACKLVALNLRWTGPLGLLYREDRRPLGKELKVLPDIRAVKSQALRFFARREFQVGLKVEQFVGDGSEFDALREYVPGFDRRAVDWKASARHRKLLCREFRAERNHQVLLAVDTGHLMGEPLRGIPRVDHAINAALMLTYVCLKTGDLVGAFAFDSKPRVFRRPEAGLAALRGIQDAFAKLDYSPEETNFTLGLTELLQKTRRRSLVVLFTEFVDSITTQLMVANLDRVGRRHHVLLVALRDPALAELSARTPESTGDVHRAVVAAELERERDAVLERVRRTGVQVIDAEAQQIGPALINRYLDIVRREVV